VRIAGSGLGDVSPMQGTKCVVLFNEPSSPINVRPVVLKMARFCCAWLV
jgi:hypothetical protein